MCKVVEGFKIWGLGVSDFRLQEFWGFEFGVQVLGMDAWFSTLRLEVLGL